MLWQNVKLQRSLLIGGLAAMLVGWCCAAEESPFLVDVWGTADRLPQSSVIAITQTRDGYLWLGTLNGLVRFDGTSLTPFNVNNTPGLPGNGIVFLFEDSRTNLWVGTENAGLCRINSQRVQKIDTDGAGGKITGAFEDDHGAVWFSTTDGKFFRWRNETLELHPPDFPAQFFYRVFHLHVPGNNGVVWHLQNGRVEKFRGEKLEKDFGPTPWPGSQVTALYKTPDGSFVQIPFDANVTAVAEDAEGNLIVGTRGSGVFWFDADGGAKNFSAGAGLSGKFILSLCFDREGDLWVGTDGGGLARVKRATFATRTGLTGGAAQSVTEDGQGNLWAAFNLRGLSCWQTNSARHFDIGAESRAWSVLVDQRQQVWAGTSGEGLFRLEAGAFRPVAAASLCGRQIYALFESRNGWLWVGGQDALGSFDGQNWKFYARRDGLPPNAIRALAEDAKGNLWIGTEGGGLFCLSNGIISSVAVPMKDISSLLTDREDNLWVGTSSHGLARFAGGRWTRCSTLDGLVADDINYLAEDDAGNLWVGSYEGLWRVSEKSIADFAAGRAKKISGRLFFAHECSAGAQPAVLRARDGNFWFPTTEGLVAVKPGAIKRNSNPPPVIIEAVRVDGVQQNNNLLGSAAGSAITLYPGNEQLEIHFTSLNFSAPKGAQFGGRFRYQLEEVGDIGKNKNWIDAGGEHVAHFNNKLLPGHYVFQVAACNEDGVWNDTAATLSVTVKPPFWRRPGFIAASLLVFAGALAGVIYLISTAKLKRQLRLARQKEMLEKERARIARDLHDQLGANLTQIALLGEMAESDKQLPEEVEQHAQQIYATARETTRALDEIVWAVNPANDTLEGLANYACKYAQDYFALAGVSYRAELPAVPPITIPPEVRHNVFLAFKEAVNNVVKHARATEAHVILQMTPDQFILSVTDNGRGLGDLSEKKLRNGLKNMRKRLGDIHGEFTIVPGEKGGTVVTMAVPLKFERSTKPPE